MNQYEILENCLAALEGGEDIDSVLARYPDLAQDLRPILEAARQARASSITVPNEVLRRARARLLQRAAEMREARQPKSRRLIPFIPRVAITFGIVGALALSSTRLVSASAGALPGDQLYPVKRTWEGMRLFFVFNPEGRDLLESEFEQERLDEIDGLLTKGRAAPIVFSGLVTNQQGGRWLVSGIPIQVTASTRLPADGILKGAPVMVTGLTRSDGVVEAQEIQILQPGVPLPPLEPSDNGGNHGETEDSQATPPANVISSPGTPAPESQQTKGEHKSYEFTGVVVSMQGTQWNINGQSVSVEQAEISGDIRVGSVVKFEGYYDSNGMFVVTKMEIRSSDNGSTGGGQAGDGAGTSEPEHGGSGGDDGDGHGGGDGTPHP